MLRDTGIVVLGVLAGAAGLIVLALSVAAAATRIIAWRAEAQHPRIGRLVPVAGGDLAVWEAGPGEGARATVVLLHGASANAADPMMRLGPELAARGFRVLAFDRPGFGWSDRLGDSGEAATPAFQARAIGEALDRLGTGPVVVLGHSWGGALALRMALDRPDRVAGLVLAAPVALPLPERPLPWWARLALQPPLTWLLSRTVAAPLGLAYLPGTARTVFRPQAMPPDFPERARATLVLRPVSALATVRDLAALAPALAEQAPRYSGLRVPVAIVAGEADPAVPLSTQAEPLSRVIPGATLRRLPGIGHMLQIVAAEAVADEVEALAARVGPPP